MDDLITWLRACLDEREADYRRGVELYDRDSVNGDESWIFVECEQGLREVEAKREIIRKWEVDHGNGYPDYSGGYESALEDVIAVIAAPFSDRPGYREEWKP